MPKIRTEIPDDYAVIATITEVAFGRPVEARMIEAIRDPDGAWMAIPLRAYSADVRGQVVFPPWFPNEARG